MSGTDPEPTGPKFSDCCGVPVNTDYLICPDCLEHTTAIVFDEEGNELEDEKK